MGKIDFVLPFVDMNDKVWQEEYRKERIRQNLPTAILKTDYRSWDNLKYVFRSIAKNTPWANKVHFIVSNPEQIPDWINTDNVSIVFHKDIIPNEFLPCFSSRAIEMFIGNIPSLSENFVYMNDDFYILNRLGKNDFFEYGKPKLSFRRHKGLDTMFKRIEWRELKLASDYFKKELPDPEKEFPGMPHEPAPMLRNTLETVSDIFKAEIRNSITPFEDEKNFNQYIYTYYQRMSGNYSDSQRRYRYEAFKPKESDIDKSKNMIRVVSGIQKVDGKNDKEYKWLNPRDYVFNKANEIARIIMRQKFDTLCINDNYDFKNEELFENVKIIINSSFKKIFPEKCKYEL